MVVRLFRWICFLITLTAVATAWVWSERPAWVATTEWHLVDRYKGNAALRIGEIRKDFYVGKFEPHLEELRSLRERYEQSEYGDRFFQVWRAAAELESEALAALERWSDMLPWLEKAVERDEFSVPLWTRLLNAQALTAVRGGTLQGAEAMDHWYHKLPYHPQVVASRHLRWLLKGETGDWVGSLAKDRQNLLRYLSRDWQAFLFLEGEGGILNSPLQNLQGPDANGFYRLSFRFPQLSGALTRLRLDPPSRLGMRLSELRMSAYSGADETAVFEGVRPEQLAGVWLESPDQWVVEESPDQNLTYHTSAPIPVEAPVRIEVTFRLEPIFGTIVRQRLQDPELQTALRTEAQRLGVSLDLARWSPPVWERFR